MKLYYPEEYLKLKTNKQPTLQDSLTQVHSIQEESNLNSPNSRPSSLSTGPLKMIKRAHYRFIDRNDQLNQDLDMDQEFIGSNYLRPIKPITLILLGTVPGDPVTYEFTKKHLKELKDREIPTMFLGQHIEPLSIEALQNNIRNIMLVVSCLDNLTKQLSENKNLSQLSRAHFTSRDSQLIRQTLLDTVSNNFEPNYDDLNNTINIIIEYAALVSLRSLYNTIVYRDVINHGLGDNQLASKILSYGSTLDKGGVIFCLVGAQLMPSILEELAFKAKKTAFTVEAAVLYSNYALNKENIINNILVQNNHQYLTLFCPEIQGSKNFNTILLDKMINNLVSQYDNKTKGQKYSIDPDSVSEEKALSKDITSDTQLNSLKRKAPFDLSNYDLPRKQLECSLPVKSPQNNTSWSAIISNKVLGGNKSFI